ncbi:MAG: MFS transporter [Dehalococcoidia bacterium]|nr:MFS transporter [Dehalococcoidia bacterium]
MGFRETLSPKPTISDQDVAKGLHNITWEGVTAMGLFSITTSGFLAAYALLLGCSNFQIGVLAAIPFLTQPVQLFIIPLVERIRRRKAIALLSWIPAQSAWIFIALIPLFLDIPSSNAAVMLLGIMAIRGVFVSVTNCAWNSWIRDLVPQQVLGSFFARRQMWTNLAAMAFGLLAAFFVSYWEGRAPGNEALGYTIILLFGAVFLGLASPLFMSRIPEPLMQPAPAVKPSLFSTIASPLRDANYRHLVWFLFLWGLALNMSIPFFAVYMLVRLGLPLPWVIGFSILSQAFNILFLRIWGPLADRFGLKAILSVSVSLYLLVVLGWAFTTMPDRHLLTIPLLVGLHIFAGIAAAGASFTTATIGLKLAPQGEATAYLAVASLGASLGAGLGPLAGGYLGDFFSTRQVSLVFTWIDPARSIELPTFDLIGFDFLFLITFVLGFFTLNVLRSLREEGEASREIVVDALLAPMQDAVRPMSSVPGLTFLSQFPYGILRRVPVPGLDVALGVTAYQLAEIARAATVAAVRGQRRVTKIARALEQALIGVGTTQDIETHSIEVGRQTARGAMHAKEAVGLDVDRLAHSAVLGIARTFGHARLDPGDALRGAGYGIVQGAGETGVDYVKAAVKAVEAARKVAEQAGLSEEQAAAYVAQGALDAAAAMGAEALAQVEDSLPEDVLLPESVGQQR